MNHETTFSLIRRLLVKDTLNNGIFTYMFVIDRPVFNYSIKNIPLVRLVYK
jgi:hypothetical protein